MLSVLLIFATVSCELWNFVILFVTRGWNKSVLSPVLGIPYFCHFSSSIAFNVLGKNKSLHKIIQVGFPQSL